MERNTIKRDFNGEQREVDKVAWYGTIAILLVVIFVGGPSIAISYKKKMDRDRENWRPGKRNRLENDLEATNRNGEIVRLEQLRGKVWVMAYQYTDDENGSIEMAAVMKDLLEKFGDYPEFHMVSITANPTVDTPEKMDAWIKKYGIDSPRWWFLTADEKILSKYMYGEFKLIPSRITEKGIEQDKGIRIVDGKANIRGFQEVSHPVGGPTAKKFLYRDLEMVLDPSKKIADYEEIDFPKEALKK